MQARQRNRLWQVLPTLAFLLASCSGGSGGGTQSQPTLMATPTPVQTPAPTPTPTPSATPTPLAYMFAWDFTRDRSFTAIGLRIASDRSAATPVTEIRLDPESATIGFNFIAATRTYQARYNSDSITAVTQIGPVGRLISDESSFDIFDGTNSRFVRTPLSVVPVESNVLIRSAYVGYVEWSDNNWSGISDAGTRGASRRLLFGARTVSADLPLSGATTFTGQSIVTGPGGGGGRNAMVVVDYAARTVVGTTMFQPPSTGGTGSSGRPLPTPEQITFSGTLDPATGRISGTIEHVLTRTTGRFEGALYGPSGLEVGILFVIGPANRADYNGVLAARR